MIIDYTPQGEPAWFELRRGKPSASRFSEIITSKGEPSKSRQAYLYDLSGQRVSGRIEETFKSARMQSGNDNESKSRMDFEFSQNVTVDQVGCIFPDEDRRYLASPDGLILSREEGFETKDACFKVQIERLKKGTLPAEHFHQVQGSMLVSGYKHWWFTSYCEGLPSLTLPIPRDEKFIDTLKHALDDFCKDLDDTVEWLRSL
jgi:hypothetical protein